jgi:hypothetical protein
MGLEPTSPSGSSEIPFYDHAVTVDTLALYGRTLTDIAGEVNGRGGLPLDSSAWLPVVARGL